MLRPYDAIESLAHEVIGCAIEVHRIIGPGLLESVYRECMVVELQERRLSVDPAGLLMNFNEVLLKDGLRRLDHPDRYLRSEKLDS